MDDLLRLFHLVGVGLVLMLPLANPLTSMSLLLSLGSGIPYRERQKQITQSAFYVFGIMLVAYFGGTLIMKSFGISIPGLRIAGGLIVSGIGFQMLSPSSRTDDMPEADTVSEQIATKKTTNIAFVPLAMPGTAGPGNIAMIISTTASIPSSITSVYSHWFLHTAAIIVFLLLSLLFWLALRFAGRVVAVIGQSGVEAISRIMGFLLVCMGVQFIINGVLEIATEFMATQAV